MRPLLPGHSVICGCVVELNATLNLLRGAQDRHHSVVSRYETQPTVLQHCYDMLITSQESLDSQVDLLLGFDHGLLSLGSLLAQIVRKTAQN